MTRRDLIILALVILAFLAIFFAFPRPVEAFNNRILRCLNPMHQLSVHPKPAMLSSGPS